MVKRTRSIQFRMYIVYTAGLMFLIAIMIIAYFIRTYSIMREEITSSSDQVAINLINRIDTDLRQLSTLTEKIVFSNNLRDIFLNQLPGSDAIARYHLQNQLNDLIYSITGPNLDFFQMNIIDISGYKLSFGQEYNYKRINNEKLDDISWLSDVISLDGKRFISPLHESYLNTRPEKVISVCRGFGELIGLPIRGIVEVQQEHGYIEKLIESTAFIQSGHKMDYQIIVLDQKGNTVYPLGMNYEMISFYNTNTANLNSEEIRVKHKMIKNPYDGGCELVSYAMSNFSGWRAIIIIPEQKFIRPIQILRNQTIFIGLILFICALVMSLYMSRVLTVPIRKLHQSIQRLTLENLSSENNLHINSGIDELEQLNNMFNMMVVRLHESLDEVVASKNMEMHSRMLALQAQMNPHFIYNTLTVISIMADNGEKQDVQWACRNLSNMLEYVSSEAVSPVSLKEEISHTLSYIELIKMRYMEDISFSVDIPKDMMNVQMPKLIIQPLVENSVKYATNKHPVWEISLHAWTEGNKWFVSVKDNGYGFSEDKLAEIDEKIHQLKVLGEIPELSLNGMGIMNIFLRLKLFYKEDFYFKIDNYPKKGATITVGGAI